MENLSRLYGKFAGKIIASINKCEGNSQCLKMILIEFKKAGIIPRAILYKAILEKNQKEVDLIQKLFRKEISLAILGCALLMNTDAIATEVEEEIAIWQQIWEREKAQ